MAKPATSRGSRKDSLMEFCRALPHATEDVKWGCDRVFSIGGKMFAVFDEEADFRVAFKCTEEGFDELTRQDGIIPAPYAARFFWVSVSKPSALSPAALRRLLRCSYDLVLGKLPARARAALVETPARRPAPWGRGKNRSGS